MGEAVDPAAGLGVEPSVMTVVSGTSRFMAS
jgi:hypothetical protein